MTHLLKEQDMYTLVISHFILALSDIAYLLYETTGLELPVLLDFAHSLI